MRIKINNIGLTLFLIFGMTACADSDKTPEYVTSWSIHPPTVTRDGHEIAKVNNTKEDFVFRDSDEIDFGAPVERIQLRVKTTCTLPDGKTITGSSAQTLRERHSFQEFMPAQSVLLASLPGVEMMDCEYGFSAKNSDGSIHKFSFLKRRFLVSGHGELRLEHRYGLGVADFSKDKVLISSDEFENYIPANLPENTKSLRLACTFVDIMSESTDNPFLADDIRMALIQREQNADVGREYCRLFALGAGNILAASPLMEVQFSALGPQVRFHIPDEKSYAPGSVGEAFLSNTTDEPMILSVDLESIPEIESTVVVSRGAGKSVKYHGIKRSLDFTAKVNGAHVLKSPKSELRFVLMPSATVRISFSALKPTFKKCGNGYAGPYGHYVRIPDLIIRQVLDENADPSVPSKVISVTKIAEEYSVWRGFREDLRSEIHPAKPIESYIKRCR